MLFRSPQFFFVIESWSCLSAKPIRWNWIPPHHRQEIAGEFSWRTRIWLEVDGNMQVRDDPDKNLFARAMRSIFASFSSFFLSKDRHKTKRKPSNAKYVHIKKYRYLKAKADHFENAIDFVWYGCLCKWPNPDDVRFAGWAPVKSKCVRFATYFAQCLGVGVQVGSVFWPSMHDRSRSATRRGRSEQCEQRGTFSMLSGRVARSFAWL